MKLMACDPGTRFCGLAFFESGQLAWVRRVSAVDPIGVVRAAFIYAQVEIEVRTFAPDVLVVERVVPNRKRPAGILDGFAVSLRSLARQHRIAYTTYLPSQYLKAGDLLAARLYARQTWKEEWSDDEAAAWLLGRHYLAEQRVQEVRDGATIRRP